MEEEYQVHRASSLLEAVEYDLESAANAMLERDEFKSRDARNSWLNIASAADVIKTLRSRIQPDVDEITAGLPVCEKCGEVKRWDKMFTKEICQGCHESMADNPLEAVG